MQILITGAAGFIGFHLCKRLLVEGFDVLGLDNINEYYDQELKYARLEQLGINRKQAAEFHSCSNSHRYKGQFQFVRVDLEDRENLPALFKKHKVEVVCNLAAQGGVRYSIDNPEIYVDSNITGFLNLLECCRRNKVKHLIYASSSSVYGLSNDVPFKETANVDNPVSLYAATKKCNELMASTYSHLYHFKTTGLRFFTVYGPWGRPDMATFLFTKAIWNRKPIKVFNNGDLERDFTYIDDIVEGVYKVIRDERKDPEHKIYNIGNNAPISLMGFIEEIETQLEIPAIKQLLPMQPGDVIKTWADVSSLKRDFGYEPNTPLKEGIKNFLSWFKMYYKIEESNKINDVNEVK